MATPRHQLETSSSGRRTAVVAAVLVALLVAVWFLFLRAGAEEEAFAPPAAPAVTEEEIESDEESEEAGARRGQVETFEVFASRDPFLPVVRPAAAAGGSAAAEDTAEPGEATASGESGDTEHIGGHRVRLVSVSGGNGRPSAQVEVDATVYTVSEGQDFAERFRLLSISGGCATMLFGDDQFTLCEGEEILK